MQLHLCKQIHILHATCNRVGRLDGKLIAGVCAVSVFFVDNMADRPKCICPLLSFIFASTLPAIQWHSIDIRFASHRIGTA